VKVAGAATKGKEAAKSFRGKKKKREKSGGLSGGRNNATGVRAELLWEEGKEKRKRKVTTLRQKNLPFETKEKEKGFHERKRISRHHSKISGGWNLTDLCHLTLNPHSIQGISEIGGRKEKEFRDAEDEGAEIEYWKN